MTIDTQELDSLLAQISVSEHRLEHQQSDLEKAEKCVQTSRSQLYALRERYRNQRRDFILATLNHYERSMCAYCKRLRPHNQMRTSCEMGYRVDSDCRYNRWNVEYKNFFPICLLCVEGIEFSTREEEGYKVGKELLQFDPEVHRKWITWGSDNLEAAARALHIELPAI